jgi:hypothetical protein
VRRIWLAAVAAQGVQAGSGRGRVELVGDGGGAGPAGRG